ncbi:MAG TPA: ADP compounds hydrolase NudE [Oleiagrimonas sp.]|nr:ADP compounds hydrolase NudE [Oleiagrimonas sp.]
MPTPPRILARHSNRQSRFLHTEQLDLEFSNGVRRTYERMLNAGHGAVIIVPMRDHDTVLLIREYAAGLQHYELGLPKGRLDAGESATDGGNRELKEEAGYGARRLEALGHLSLAPAYMSHVTDVVLARDLYPERLPGDEPEEMEVVPWKLSELHTLIARDDVTEGRTMAALFMAREYLAGRYQVPA